MKELGFLYVLANSAMPNMVKVGKTTRSSSERAEELSKVTGLPTPFIVVYEQLFEDCGEAELFVHMYLENRGYRVAENREFFNAPVSIVVKAIALAPNSIDSSQVESLQAQDDLTEYREPDELDGLSFDDSEVIYPWTDIFNEAEAHYYGFDDNIEDYAEALRLYRQAANLGALPAYSRIGRMYEHGEGVREDKNKALDFYKEGARKGSASCYWRMAILFANADNRQNAEKCFSLFLKNKPTHGSDNQVLTHDELHSIFLDCCGGILGLLKERGHEYPILSEFIADNYYDISSNAARMLEYCQSSNDYAGANMYQSVIKFLDSTRQP